jgi:nucleoside-diphosphate-sugar epimerase
MKKVIITGIDGFTGVYLEELLQRTGYDVYGLVYPTSRNKKHLSCNIADRDDVIAALNAIKPDYIIHLAGISFIQHSDVRQFYDINLFGTLNILKALLDIGLKPKKILMASSANVYGNPSIGLIDETVCPAPVNHYAISKLAMEFKARTYFDRLNILITRPFNYTGVGQAAHFLIPKIVSHYKERKQEIELGNLDVVREFSDVRNVADVYKKLMECNTSSEIVNICSGRGISLKDILQQMNTIARHELRTRINPEFVRKNEVQTLIGSNKKLVSLIGELESYPIEETLKWMFDAI